MVASVAVVLAIVAIILSREGVKGENGADWKGDKGEKGAYGEGIKGEQGADGEGVKGEKGADGDGVVHWVSETDFKNNCSLGDQKATMTRVTMQQFKLSAICSIYLEFNSDTDKRLITISKLGDLLSPTANYTIDTTLPPIIAFYCEQRVIYTRVSWLDDALIFGTNSLNTDIVSINLILHLALKPTIQ